MATINIPEIKGSSNNNKSEKEKVIKPVVKVEDVSTKKKSVGRKITDTFIKEDVSTVKNHLFFDVIVPTLKDMAINGMEMLFYGTTSNRNGVRRSSNDRTSYQKYYDGNQNRPQNSHGRNSERYDTDDVILRTRSAAEDVLTSMCDILDEYHTVSVADLYTLLDMEEKSQYTDQWWGWTDLSTSSVRRISDGYLIDLPRVQNLRR